MLVFECLWVLLWQFIHLFLSLWLFRSCSLNFNLVSLLIHFLDTQNSSSFFTPRFFLPLVSSPLVSLSTDINCVICFVYSAIDLHCYYYYCYAYNDCVWLCHPYFSFFSLLFSFILNIYFIC